MNDFIDIYCERLGPGFWAEPVNALTNSSFFIAAFFAWRLARAQGALDWRSISLIVLMVLIGTGSFLFHTLAVMWAQIADVLPILFYQIVFLCVYAQRVIRIPCPYSYAILLPFLGTIWLFGFLPEDLFNGSIQYGPALLFLSGLALWHVWKAEKERLGLLAAVGVFLISLTFRSIDMRVCGGFTPGTHFLWHILNGAVLYLTTRAYILNAARSDICVKSFR